MSLPAIFVIDVLSATREWLSTLLEENNIKVTCFNSAESFLYYADINQVGCIILENRLSGIDGISLQAELARRQSPLSLIFHCENITSSSAVNAMKAGAIDILTKFPAKEKLIETVEQGVQASTQKAAEMANRQILLNLTKKEKIVLAELLKGLTNQKIAASLDISLRTVEVHRASIMKKFDANNAISLAIKLANIMKL